MAEANGVFVHLFRNKEAFESIKSELEMKRKKWEAEKEHRLKLAESVGLKGASLQAQIPQNSAVELALAYPKFQTSDDLIYDIWVNFAEGRDQRNITFWPEIGTAYLPVEVLEEMRLVNELAIFQNVRLSCIANAWLLVGSDEKAGQRFLIAYWGSKEVHDNIQKQLVELQKSKAEAEAAKLEEKNSETKNVDNPRAGLVFMGVISIVLAVLTHVIMLSPLCETSAHIEKPLHGGYCNEVDYESIYQLPSGIVVKKERKHCDENCANLTVWILTPDDRIPWPLGVSPTIYYRVQLNDKTGPEKKISETSDACSICEVKAIDSVYALPEGEVVWLWFTDRLGAKHSHYHLEYRLPNGLILEEAITKEVLSKLRIGDKIPFKRPEY